MSHDLFEGGIDKIYKVATKTFILISTENDKIELGEILILILIFYKSVVENKKCARKRIKRALVIVNRDHKSSPDLEKVASILMKSTPLS